MVKGLLPILTGLLLAGCASAPQDFEPDFRPTAPDPEPVASAPSGSLFLSSRTAWFGEARASRVGDTVTILLQESTHFHQPREHQRLYERWAGRHSVGG